MFLFRIDFPQPWNDSVASPHPHLQRRVCRSFVLFGGFCWHLDIHPSNGIHFSESQMIRHSLVWNHFKSARALKELSRWHDNICLSSSSILLRSGATSAFSWRVPGGEGWGCCVFSLSNIFLVCFHFLYFCSNLLSYFGERLKNISCN